MKFNKIIQSLKPDSEVVETLFFVLIIGILLFCFIYVILPNISGSSNYEDCVPNYMGSCDS